MHQIQKNLENIRDCLPKALNIESEIIQSQEQEVDKMRHKLAMLMLVTVFISTVSSFRVSTQREIPTDYIIIFDASASMNKKTGFVASDFIECDAGLLDLANRGEECEKIKIAKTNIRCYLEHYAKSGDRVSLIIVDKDPAGIETLRFQTFEEINEIYEIFDSMERGNYEKSPVIDAISKAVEMYHDESTIGRKHMLLITTDFDYVDNRNVDEFCNEIREIRLKIGYLTEGMKIDSIVFFGLIDEEKWPMIEKIKTCLKNNLPIATVFDTPQGDLTFEILDEIEEIKYELSELFEDNIQKEIEINNLKQLQEDPQNFLPKSRLFEFLEDLKFPIIILFFISIALLISGSYFIFNR